MSKCKYSAVKVSAVTTQKTQEFSAKVNDNVIKPTKSKVQEGTLLSDISSGTKSWASKVATASSKGWKDFTSMLTEDPDQQDNPTTQGGYQDAPLMRGQTKPHTEEQSRLLDLDTSDTPLLQGVSPSPRQKEVEDDDEDWSSWANGNNWEDTTKTTKSSKMSTKSNKKSNQLDDDEDGWDSWGDQNDLLIDFGDNDPIAAKSNRTQSSKKTTKTSSKKVASSSSKKVTSLEETWDDAEGWDDAAWEAVETELNIGKKNRKGD